MSRTTTVISGGSDGIVSSWYSSSTCSGVSSIPSHIFMLSSCADILEIPDDKLHTAVATAAFVPVGVASPIAMLFTCVPFMYSLIFAFCVYVPTT